MALTRDRVSGFFHRLGWAIALSLLVWNLSVLPLGLDLRWLSPVLDILNAPVGVVSLLVPCPERGLDTPFAQCHHEGGQNTAAFFISHLRLAVPVYVLLFYLPNLVLFAHRRVRPGRATASASAVAILFLIAAPPALAASRGPSTPEERSHAVALVRALETDPLKEGARDARTWLVIWLSEIPDIAVQMCPALLGENFEVNKKYAAELALQQSLSSAAFIIEHPDRANDKLAVSLAGVEGVFKAYGAILAQKPKAHFKSLDALIEAKSKGALESIIAQNVRACT